MSESFTLIDFVRESNRIENIHRAPTHAEMRAHEDFLGSLISVDSLRQFVRTIAPGADLRDQPGMDVVIGNHRPPRGGPNVVTDLTDLLRRFDFSPFEKHVAYERIHPFMDGNGRSGRVLWLKMMGGIDNAPLGFLHHWYYQSLDAFHRVSVGSHGLDKEGTTND